MDETNQIKDLDKRITDLEQGSFGPDPAINPLTFQNLKNSFVAGTGIFLSSAIGTIKIANSGVTSLVSGTAISLSSGTGTVMISNIGVAQLTAGTNIFLSPSNGTGVVMISSTRLSMVSGSDTESMFSNAQVTHTITHGLGTPPKIIYVASTFQPLPPAGSNTNQGWTTGDIILDGSGNIIGGSYWAFLVNTFTFVGTATAGGNITGQAVTSGGTGTSSVAVNNVTSTTFDIVYNSTAARGGASQDFTVYWYVQA